jgi:nickel/cobalt exporter
MQNFSEYLSSGHVWLYVPVAILLGALHGLEPGHSKTMMAAFIIAIRGTVWQAVLLGLSAAISHSLLIWVLAALALNYGSQWNAETIEPWLQIGSAILILALAIWMYLRTRREVAEAHAHEHPHTHTQSHDHSHTHDAPAPTASSFQHDIALPAGFHVPARLSALATQQHTHAPLSEGREACPKPPPERPNAPFTPHGGMLLDTGHGWLEIAIFTDADSHTSRFRIHPCTATGAPQPLPRGNQLTLETARLDGSTQLFKFEPVPAGGYWEATAPLPAPHSFTATLTLGHSDHAHTYRLKFSEAAAASSNTGQSHAPVIAEEIKLPGEDVYQDAHERAHAEDIARRFGARSVTTPQIILFGITGGLMPCPAAFTILLVCLQLKKVALGFAIVGAFSFGLALTMVTVGAVAAWSVQHAQKRFTGFGDWMRKAPYISCLLLTLLALYMAWSGYHSLSHPHTH